MKQNDIQAFPWIREFQVRGCGIERKEHMQGMTLRDWFAGKALSGVASLPGLDPSDITLAAKRCYEIADKMLEERSK